MDKTYGCGQARASRERCILMRAHDANDVDSPGSKHLIVEPMTGIEPAYSAWEADVLPLNYIGLAGRASDHEG
jgi:hypothetical protein